MTSNVISLPSRRRPLPSSASPEAGEDDPIAQIERLKRWIDTHVERPRPVLVRNEGRA